jgi:hypothetical protein
VRARAAAITALALAVGFVSAAREAHAEGAPPPKNALSIETVALLDSGFAVQYERFVLPPVFSAVTRMGVRASGGDDFDVLESSFGAEGRFWLLGRAPFSRFDGRAMVGPFLGVGIDAGVVREWHRGHVIGTTLRVGQYGTIGVRFAFARRFELTPTFGAGFRTEVDARGRLAPWTRAELVRLGLGAGVLF